VQRHRRLRHHHAQFRTRTRHHRRTRRPVRRTRSSANRSRNRTHRRQRRVGPITRVPHPGTRHRTQRQQCRPPIRLLRQTQLHRPGPKTPDPRPHPLVRPPSTSSADQPRLTIPMSPARGSDSSLERLGRRGGISKRCRSFESPRARRWRCHKLVTSRRELRESTGDGLRRFQQVGLLPDSLRDNEIRPESDWGSSDWTPKPLSLIICH